ncbi:hypothetical protein ACFZ8E_26720 [Methylobacterium sp. HMF5984]|uniref:hypothetical protein n=1 Tax=Methylobacterium sp. HMF5984 TaxID=3367370 RepID=UPI00385421E0
MHSLEERTLRETQMLIDRVRAHRAEHDAMLQATRAAIRTSLDRIARVQAKYGELPNVRRPET